MPGSYPPLSPMPDAAVPVGEPPTVPLLGTGVPDRPPVGASPSRTSRRARRVFRIRRGRLRPARRARRLFQRVAAVQPAVVHAGRVAQAAAAAHQRRSSGGTATAAFSGPPRSRPVPLRRVGCRRRSHITLLCRSLLLLLSRACSTPRAPVRDMPSVLGASTPPASATPGSISSPVSSGPKSPARAAAPSGMLSAVGLGPDLAGRVGVAGHRHVAVVDALRRVGQLAHQALFDFLGVILAHNGVLSGVRPCGRLRDVYPKYSLRLPPGASRRW